MRWYSKTNVVDEKGSMRGLGHRSISPEIKMSNFAIRLRWTNFFTILRWLAKRSHNFIVAKFGGRERTPSQSKSADFASRLASCRRTPAFESSFLSIVQKTAPVGAFLCLVVHNGNCSNAFRRRSRREKHPRKFPTEF